MFNLNRITLAGVFALSLAGCATQAPVAVPVNPDAEITAQLAVHAAKASESMQRLAALRSASAGVKVQDITVPEGLDVPLTMSWSGPIESLVRKVAEMTGYTYAGTQGNGPATPVLVSLSVNNTGAFAVLADAGAQAGSAADIVIRPSSKTMLVKFPPTTRSGGYVQPVSPKN